MTRVPQFEKHWRKGLAIRSSKQLSGVQVYNACDPNAGHGVGAEEAALQDRSSRSRLYFRCRQGEGRGSRRGTAQCALSMSCLCLSFSLSLTFLGTLDPYCALGPVARFSRSLTCNLQICSYKYLLYTFSFMFDLCSGVSTVDECGRPCGARGSRGARQVARRRSRGPAARPARR